MRPQAIDALAASQDISRLVPIGEGQLRGEAAHSQCRPQAGLLVWPLCGAIQTSDLDRSLNSQREASNSLDFTNDDRHAKRA